jgi:hypothetical protein
MRESEQNAVQTFFDDEGKPVLRRSFCEFMDVLEFNEHVAESFRETASKTEM